MESYQWQYQPTPEDIRKAAILPRTIEVVTHSAGLIYFFVYLFSGSYNTIRDIIFPFTYIILIFLWYFRLKKIFRLGFTLNTIDENGIKIVNVDKGIKKYYEWDKLESFFLGYSDKHIEVYTRKDFRGNYNSLILRVTENEKSKVAQILSTRLEENK